MIQAGRAGSLAWLACPTGKRSCDASSPSNKLWLSVLRICASSKQHGGMIGKHFYARVLAVHAFTLQCCRHWLHTQTSKTQLNAQNKHRTTMLLHNHAEQQSPS